MGTFEKLGILVIVVIIVMILAVAISQWGGIAESDAAVASPTSALTVHDVVDPPAADPPTPDPRVDPAPAPAAEAWPGGVPKSYEIREGDSVWVLVVRRWGLKETFIAAIDAANPRVNVARVRPGVELAIPDPTPYRRGAAKRASAHGTRLYEVQVGDRLESIAKKHLGKRSRWKDILLLNPGLDARRLKPGQKLRLPAR